MGARCAPISSQHNCKLAAVEGLMVVSALLLLLRELSPRKVLGQLVLFGAQLVVCGVDGAGLAAWALSRGSKNADTSMSRTLITESNCTQRCPYNCLTRSTTFMFVYLPVF